MKPWQQRYIDNARRIMQLMDFSAGYEEGFAAWHTRRREAEAACAAARQENNALLTAHLFPLLDTLYSADEATLQELSAFADVLMDWRTNLDCGIYVIIHDALLTLCRVRGDRDGIIRELYKLGMGLYYLGRIASGISHPLVETFRFQNEMVFTEAASYLRYFEQMDSEETRGYIVRSLANIALCANGARHKIAATSRALQVIRDERLRALAPGLPWDRFLRGSHQQMSANRSAMNESGLEKEELVEVLDSCYEVFRQEEGVENPSNRWLWPYYEMAFTFGYASLETTVDRLETLIRNTPPDASDMSGLYGNVQLPLFYGLLMRDHPNLRRDQARIHFLGQAYSRMAHSLMTLPPDRFDDYLVYLLGQVITEFYELEGLITYEELMLQLMRRYAGEIYITSCHVGALMRLMTEAVYRLDPTAFDDVPRIAALPQDGKQEALCAWAEKCGLLHAIGRIKMSILRTQNTRELLDSEYQLYTLYTVSGHDDLAKRASTRDCADIALGHRSWYNGSDGYPSTYIRAASPSRQMTDVAALCVYMQERRADPMADILRDVYALEGQRFSPLVTRALADEALIAQLTALLQEDGEAYYRAAWEAFSEG